MSSAMTDGNDRHLPDPLDGRPQISRYAGLGVLSSVLLMGVLVSLAFGSVSIPLSDVITVLFGGQATNPTRQQIILQFRLPRTITAIAAGSALATSGLQLQALFRNPLAGPSLLGINAGASLGAALVVLTRGTANAGNDFVQISIVGAASLGAGMSMGVVLLVAQRVRSALALLIFGLMFGYMTTALVTILLHFSLLTQTQAYLNWTFGSFSNVTWQQMPLLLPVIALGLGGSQLLHKALNLLLLGEAQAQSIGLSVNRTRCLLIFSSSLLSGSVTAFCGPIAFVGVAVPHLCRSLFRTVDHRILVPAVALLGAILALIADAISQLPGSQSVLPLNAVMAVLGAPILIWLMLKRQQSSY